MITFKQEKNLATISTVLVIMAAFIADKEDFIFFEPGIFLIYSLGLGSMWYNIYRKSKEQDNIDTKKYRE